MNAEKEEPATDDEPFKSPFAKTISKVTPALVSAANRTRDTFATWMKTRRETKKPKNHCHVAPRRLRPTGALPHQRPERFSARVFQTKPRLRDR